MKERFARLEALIGPASEMEPAAAARWLAEQLKGEPALLAEAHALLEAGTRTDEFLEAPGPGRADQQGAFEPGSRIGGFRLVRLLGKGGMGAVYLAEQEEPRRAVALKILTASWLRPSSLERFRFEVQALASLRHPGVAQVYETGVHVVDVGPIRHELPWFAMEYVEEARTLLAYANAHSLSTEARLEVFASVCDAVHHGHQKGVVHRDLKPDNVLVDGAGRVKIIDFGIARLADADARMTTLRSNASEIAGTLPYMAPEQVLGDVGGTDLRSDVYALGVVLFEILTGVLPIEVDRRDLVTSARVICERSPRRLSSARPDLRGDLEAIATKALEKDPTRRYASADELARDVRRYLTHRPVEARAPGALYHLRLFTRRHRAMVVAFASVFVIAVAAAVVSSAFAVRSETARSEAETARREAEAQRSRAEDLFEAALERNADTTFRFFPRILALAQGAPVAKALVEAVQEDVAQLEARAEHDPRARILLAETYLKLGDAQGSPSKTSLRDWDSALASYEHALAVIEAVAATGHESFGLRRCRVRALWRIAQLHTYHGRLEQAEARLQEADPHARALADAFPQTLSASIQPANLDGIRTRIAIQRKDYAAAAEHSRRQVERLVALAQRGDGFVERILGGRQVRAFALVQAGELEQAEAELTQAFLMLERESDPSSRSFSMWQSVAEIHHMAAELAGTRGRFEEAQRHFLAARTAFLQMKAQAPTDRRVRVLGHMVFGGLATLEETRAMVSGLPAQQVRAHLEAAVGHLKEALSLTESSTSRHAQAFGDRLRTRIAALRARITPP